ncbi:MAG: T9SS type A sorting domain-containing protein, partial [Bacteroidia bacterium]|nr:T9SS type A sorting domain-containing protein [Bacteroidia bacterium]
ANGKIVISKTCNNPISKYTIDVKELNPAIYLLRITSNGQSNTVKIVKQ